MKLKLLNAIKCDLNKSIINIGFAGAVFADDSACFHLLSLYRPCHR